MRCYPALTQQMNRKKSAECWRNGAVDTTHWLGVGVTITGVGMPAVGVALEKGVGLLIGSGVGKTRVGKAVGSAEPRKTSGPTKLRTKLRTIIMLKRVVNILALRLLRCCFLDRRDRLTLSS